MLMMIMMKHSYNRIVLLSSGSDDPTIRQLLQTFFTGLTDGERGDLRAGCRQDEGHMRSRKLSVIVSEVKTLNTVGHGDEVSGQELPLPCVCLQQPATRNCLQQSPASCNSISCTARTCFRENVSHCASNAHCNVPS